MEDRLGKVEDRLGKVEDRLGKVEEDLKEVREDVKATRRDVLDIGDRFVPRPEFDRLFIRVGKLEQRPPKKKGSINIQCPCENSGLSPYLAPCQMIYLTPH